MSDSVEIKKSLLGKWEKVSLNEAMEWAGTFSKSLHFITPILIEAGNRRVRGITFEELLEEVEQ